MADIADIANDFTDYMLAFQVEKIRRSAMKQHLGAKECIDCDSEIPLARRKMGFNVCVHCAEEGERRDALFAVRG